LRGWYVKGLGTGLQKEPLVRCGTELEPGAIRKVLPHRFHIFYESLETQIKANQNEIQSIENI
jgi:hypothetical protein